MKKVVFLLVAVALVFSACGQKEDAKPMADLASTEITVSAVSDSCAAELTAALSAVEGVKEVAIDSMGTLLTVSFDKAVVDAAAIEAAVPECCKGEEMMGESADEMMDDSAEAVEDAAEEADEVQAEK